MDHYSPNKLFLPDIESKCIDIDSDNSTRTEPYGQSSNSDNSTHTEPYGQSSSESEYCTVHEENNKGYQESTVSSQLTEIKINSDIELCDSYDKSTVVDRNHQIENQCNLGISNSYATDNQPYKISNRCIDISSSSDDEEFLPLSVKLKQKISAPSGAVGKLLGIEDISNGFIENADINVKSVSSSTLSKHKLESSSAIDKYCLSDHNENNGVPLDCKSNSQPVAPLKRKRPSIVQPSGSPNKKKSKTSELNKIDRLEKARERKELREAKKKEKELEKALKTAESQAKKNAKPKECIKMISAILDKRLMGHAGIGDIINALQGNEISYSIEDQLIANSIIWCRNVPEYNVTSTLQVNSVMRQEQENQIFVLLPLSEFIEMVIMFSQEKRGLKVTKNTLLEYVISIQSLHPSTYTTFGIVGLENYFREVKEKKTKATQKSRKRKMANEDENMTASRLEVEEAMLEVQLQTNNINFKLVDSMEDVGKLMIMYTKAIAEAPYKREKYDQMGFSWFAEADSSCAVKVDRNGNGLIRLWKQQIEQFANIGREVAEAIVAQYPSPQSLTQSYKKCKTNKEAQLLLKDIMVRREVGPLSTTRRVGPELSYKMHLLFTSTNENALLERS